MPQTGPPFLMFLSATEGGDASLPPVEGEAPSAARRRRWPMVAALMVAIVGIVTGVTLNRMVTTDTIAVDSLNVFRPTPGDKTGISEVRNSLGSESIVDFERNGTFLVYARLVNTGGRDVEIRGIPTHEYYYFKIDRAGVSAERNGGSGGEYLPLRRFKLSPGESRFVEIRFRLADCELIGGEGLSSGVTSLPVSYRVMGFSRTVFVDLEREALTVAGGGACDKPFVR